MLGLYTTNWAIKYIRPRKDELFIRHNKTYLFAFMSKLLNAACCLWIFGISRITVLLSYSPKTYIAKWFSWQTSRKVFYRLLWCRNKGFITQTKTLWAQFYHGLQRIWNMFNYYNNKIHFKRSLSCSDPTCIWHALTAIIMRFISFVESNYLYQG